MVINLNILTFDYIMIDQYEMEEVLRTVLIIAPTDGSKNIPT